MRLGPLMPMPYPPTVVGDMDTLTLIAQAHPGIVLAGIIIGVVIIAVILAKMTTRRPSDNGLVSEYELRRRRGGK